MSKRYRRRVYLIILLLLGAVVNAQTYYIDSRVGNDADSGISAQKPWKSLEKVNSTVFTPGDQIMFAAGSRYVGQLKPQGSGKLIDGKPVPVVIDKYGSGPKPVIDAQGKTKSTLYLFNTEYWQISNLELTNTGPEPQPRRTGVYIHLKNFGTARHIQLKKLYIHDVNGSLIKKAGGGSAIKWLNEGSSEKSRFDGLLIEDCHLVRCQRNGIIGAGYVNRAKLWHPSLNVVIRNNLLEEIPGDGIVPIGCDGALIERNVMRNCPRLLPDGEAAAGIWPWGCDNTIIQYNEVSDHKAPWDGQGFDSDWDCKNTIIQYNYSHDNEGGFLLICNNGGATRSMAINTGTIVRYNISVNDGLRKHSTHKGMFSPVFHISGPVENTKIYNNLIVALRKPDPKIDRTMIEMDNWGGPWPRNTLFVNNIFYTVSKTDYVWGQSENHTFSHNLYFGMHANLPEDFNPIFADPKFVGSVFDAKDWQSLKCFMVKSDSPCIDAGLFIGQDAMHDFWGNKRSNKLNIGVDQSK